MEDDVAMKMVKTVFSVGRDMKQSTRLGHGHWSHCTSRGIQKPLYITYKAYLERQHWMIIMHQQYGRYIEKGPAELT